MVRSAERGSGETMKRIRLVIAAAIAASAGAALVAKAANENRAPVAVTADALSWQDFSPQRPGVKIAQVSGDRLNGAWKGFVKYPPGSKAGLHTHGADLEIVVISGSFRFGESSDREKVYGPGSYIFIPAGMAHTNSTTEDTTMFEAQPAKFDAKPVAAPAK